MQAVWMAMIAAALLTGNVRADLTAGFAADAEGWQVMSYPFHGYVTNPTLGGLAQWDGVFGLPAGSIRLPDAYPETGVAAPPGWLGDRSDSYGGVLSYDIFLRYTDEAPYPAVILNGVDMSLYFDMPSPALTEWTHVTIPLSETGWMVSDLDEPATPEDFRAVLANLTGLYIYTEWNTGLDDTSVDNIFLSTGTSSVPPAPVLHATLLPSGLLRLDWSAADSADATFRIEHATQSAGPWSPLATLAGFTWTDPTLPDPDGQGMYRVVNLGSR